MKINAGTALDLLRSQIHIEVQRAPGRMPQSHWRDQNFASRKDESGGDDNVTDRPLFIVEVEIIHCADIRIECCDRVLAVDLLSFVGASPPFSCGTDS